MDMRQTFTVVGYEQALSVQLCNFFRFYAGFHGNLRLRRLSQAAASSASGAAGERPVLLLSGPRPLLPGTELEAADLCIILVYVL